MGVVYAGIALLLVLSGYLLHQILNRTLKPIKIIISTGVFLALLLLAAFVFLHDYPKPSTVDLSPLERIGSTQIENFDERNKALQETPFHRLTRGGISNYHFGTIGAPPVSMTIYTFPDMETAYHNLLIASGNESKHIIQISETVYAYTPDSIYFRFRTFRNEDMDRVVETYFIVGDVMFYLREVGDREIIGRGSSQTIERIYEAFFGD